jgi:alpha-L-rhamnosidase
MSSEASCNHGFASYIGHVLYRDVLGISRIDYINKAVTIEFTDSELKECSGAIPVDDSAVELTWKRTGNQIKYSVKIPPGYKVNIDNQSSAEVKRNEN